MDADLSLIDSHAGDVAAADFIIVFGTRHWTPAEYAAALFKRHLAPLIVVTGGAARDPERMSEAVRHRALLVAAGVPDAQVLVESESTNTEANVTLAAPLVSERLGREPSSALAVVKWYHRRALVTLAANMPSLNRIYAADYAPFNTERGIALTRENWQTSCPNSVRRETTYLRDMKQRGVDLLERAAEGGWVRSGSNSA